MHTTTHTHAHAHTIQHACTLRLQIVDYSIHLVIAPSAPTDIRTTTILPTEISIMWGPPDTPNGEIMMYSVECGSFHEPMNTSIPHYTCVKLQPGFHHTITVTGYTIAGPGVPASVQQHTPCDSKCSSLCGYGILLYYHHCAFLCCTS